MRDPIYVVSVHSGGGSMVEAADPVWACYVENRDQAEKIHDALDGALRTSKDSYIRNEWWATWCPVYLLGDLDVPLATPAQVAQLQAKGVQLKPGQIAIDFGAVVEKLANGEEIPVLPPPPPPVTAEEEAEALRSILGGGRAPVE